MVDKKQDKEEKKQVKKTVKKEIVNKKEDFKKTKKSDFWKILQNQLIEFGTIALQKGITNMAISKINETEVEIQKVVEEKIQKHSKRIIKNLIKILSFIIAGSFITYGVLEIVLRNFNLENYTNLFFGIIFLVVALVLNSEKTN